MKRTAIFVLWLLTLIAAFQLGRQAATPTRETPAVAGDRGPERDSAPRPAAVPAPRGPASSVSALRGAEREPLQAAREAARRGDVHGAIALVEAHLAVAAHDAEALFLLADLKQQIGATDAALDPLLAILAYPPDPDMAARARQRLDLLINAREQQLINAGDLAGLVSYFERLVAAEPGWDAHRLKLARWTLRSGEPDAAERILREVGHEGVSDAELTALTRELALARSALPLEREGGAIFTRGEAHGSRRGAAVKLLVDTGASLSAVSRSALERLGAEALGRSLTVHTANGVANLPAYRLRRLQVGPLVVENLTVLGLAEAPPGADGLLGMDVLGQLDAAVP